MAACGQWIKMPQRHGNLCNRCSLMFLPQSLQNRVSKGAKALTEPTGENESLCPCQGKMAWNICVCVLFSLRRVQAYPFCHYRNLFLLHGGNCLFRIPNIVYKHFLYCYGQKIHSTYKFAKHSMTVRRNVLTMRNYGNILRGIDLTTKRKMLANLSHLC